MSEPVPIRRAAPGRPPETANPPLHLAGERRAPSLTAGERLIVASGDGEPRKLGRLVLFAVLIILAGIGAESIYHAVAGALPR